MMKRLSLSAAAAAFALLCSGCLCITAPFMPPQGIITSYSAPLTTEGPCKEGTKRGSSSAINVLCLLTVGDCSLNAAIKDGGLKEMYYADYQYMNVLWLFQKVTVDVVGE